MGPVQNVQSGYGNYQRYNAALQQYDQQKYALSRRGVGASDSLYNPNTGRWTDHVVYERRDNGWLDVWDTGRPSLPQMPQTGGGGDVQPNNPTPTPAPAPAPHHSGFWTAVKWASGIGAAVVLVWAGGPALLHGGTYGTTGPLIGGLIAAGIGWGIHSFAKSRS